MEMVPSSGVEENGLSPSDGLRASGLSPRALHYSSLLDMPSPSLTAPLLCTTHPTSTGVRIPAQPESIPPGWTQHPGPLNWPPSLASLPSVSNPPLDTSPTEQGSNTSPASIYCFLPMLLPFPRPRGAGSIPPAHYNICHNHLHV